MASTPTPRDRATLLAAINQAVAAFEAERSAALDGIVALDAEQAALGYHPNYPAYVHGGIFADKRFGAAHILPLIGFHLLDWEKALDRLTAAPADPQDDPACLLVRLRHACEADAMLELAGYAWCAERSLLTKGAMNPVWIKRPKLGLGHLAKAFGIGPAEASAHRGLYALAPAVLARGLAKVADGADDRSFGALLMPVIASGGDKLARIGAAALYGDAQARYRADCASFAAHQAATPDRTWQRKPPRSRQGHLAVTTARVKAIALPAERTRGDAALWLDAHGANLRFPRGEA